MITITRAQTLALWSLAGVLPTDTVFELEPIPDDHGNLLLRVSDEGNPWLPKPRLYRILRDGGSELVEEHHVPETKAEPAPRGAPRDHDVRTLEGGRELGVRGDE